MSHDLMQSQQLFERAKKVTPGGVNSPVRAFQSVGGMPRFIQSAVGSTLKDADNHSYIDYISSWGPMILGHQHEAVKNALFEALQDGTSFGAPSWREVELAELITQITNTERLRFVNSGTEATMSALRLARGYTGRKYILKFRGNYHGHADGLLVEAGSGLLTHAEQRGNAAPSSAGVPEEYASLTLVCEYNDTEGLQQLLTKRGHEIAAIIFEPVVGNSGVLLPTEAFKTALHEAKKQGILLIADEVMTGFRLALGGATQRLGLEPDLICWGKIIGGGLPVGAYGGSARIMDCVSPVGKVYQAGTLSGNPLAMAAGLATLRELVAHPEIYIHIEQYAKKLGNELMNTAKEAGVPITINQIGSMMTVFFQSEGEIQTYTQAAKSDTQAFAKWFQSMLTQGIYWAPSQFESIFISAAHTDEDLDKTIQAAKKSWSVL